MTTAEHETPRIPCSGTCELVTLCEVIKDVEKKFGGPIHQSQITVVGLEADQVIRDVQKSLNAAGATEYYSNWRDRMQVKFAGDPEGLQRALDAINALQVDTEVAEFVNDISYQQLLEKALNYEDIKRQRAEKKQQELEAVDDALALRNEVDCPGPEQIKVWRRFGLGRKTIEVCGLRQTEEFKKIQAIKDEKYS